MTHREKWLQSNIEKFGSIEEMNKFYSDQAKKVKNRKIPEGFKDKELASRAGKLRWRVHESRSTQETGGQIL